MFTHEIMTYALFLYTIQRYISATKPFLDEKNGNQVIALCHQDVHDDLILMQIRHLAQTVISLKPPKLGDTGSFCSITHRRRHGKVLCTVRKIMI